MSEPDTSAQADADEEAQRQALLESERRANAGQPRNFKQDALDEKIVDVEPDGTGPTSTGSFDAERDRQAGSGQGGTG